MRWPTDRLLLYARTAGRLRPGQIVHRALRRLPRRGPRPTESGAAVDGAAWRILEAAVDPAPGPGSLTRAAAVAAGRFDLVGESRDLPVVDWSRTYGHLLWTYHLHYFDYAQDLARAYRATGDRRYVEVLDSLVSGWLGASDIGPGWDPYPTSLRIVNWIMAAAILGDAVDRDFRATILGGASAQLAWLERNLERDLMANHLLKNLKALTLGDWLFRGAHEGDRRRRRVPSLFWRQVREQVLPDGVHFERSPMYHAIVLADVLEILGLARALSEPVPGDIPPLIERMVEALGWLSRPDGRHHLFHDSAQDHAPPREELDRLARRVLGMEVPSPSGLVPLDAGGYYGIVEDAGSRLVIDAGPPGAPYQPGHAHCSILSFELDWQGVPLVVDSGVSGYEGDPLRAYVRSTRAHNTLMIAGNEQSEIWATFRMARRATVEGARQWLEDGEYRFSGACRPYHDRNMLHRRRITARRAEWEIADLVEGALGRQVAGFVHLHPDWHVEPVGEGFALTRGPRTILLEPFGYETRGVVTGAQDPPQGWYCPRFGERRPAPAIVLTVSRHDGRPLGYRLRSVTGA